jgi:hypothetical protein
MSTPPVPPTHPPEAKREFCLSEFALTLYLSAPAAYPELQGHLECCSRCQQRVAERRQEEEAFLREHPMDQLFQGEGETLRPLQRKKRPAPQQPVWAFWERWSSLRPLHLAATAAVALLVLSVFWFQPSFLFPSSPTRLVEKGGASLPAAEWFRFYFRRNNLVQWATPADTFRPNDEFRFQYRLPQKGYLYLVAFDAKGQLQQLYPPQDRQRRPLSPHKGWRSLPDGVQLDQSPQAERFWVCLAQKPLSRKQMQQALQQKLSTNSLENIENLPLPCLQQTSLLLRKEKNSSTK